METATSHSFLGETFHFSLSNHGSMADPDWTSMHPLASKTPKEPRHFPKSRRGTFWHLRQSLQTTNPEKPRLTTDRIPRLESDWIGLDHPHLAVLAAPLFVTLGSGPPWLHGLDHMLPRTDSWMFEKGNAFLWPSILASLSSSTLSSACLKLRDRFVSFSSSLQVFLFSSSTIPTPQASDGDLLFAPINPLCYLPSVGDGVGDNLSFYPFAPLEITRLLP